MWVVGGHSFSFFLEYVNTTFFCFYNLYNNLLNLPPKQDATVYGERRRLLAQNSEESWRKEKFLKKRTKFEKKISTFFTNLVVTLFFFLPLLTNVLNFYSLAFLAKCFRRHVTFLLDSRHLWYIFLYKVRNR